MRPLSCLLVLSLLFAGIARGEEGAEAAPALQEELFSVARDGYTVAGLLDRLPSAARPRHGIALFPGHPGILRLRQEAGVPRYDLGGNFLVRSRRDWLDGETLVLVVDAPSDEWNGFSQRFRETARYGEDVAALLRAAGERFGVAEWTAVGTSEGSISAWHAARMNPGLIRRAIFSSSVFLSSRNGPGLSGVDWKALGMPMLWVHHVDDPCRSTPYRSAENAAEKTGAPLLTVRGSEGVRGDACMAFTQHGFVGVETETVRAMRDWVKTGGAVREVVREAR